jgi:hypothetical protein
MPQEKSSSSKKPSLKAIRTNQIEKLNYVIEQMQGELAKLRDERKKQRGLLKSETEGLYEELDKLSKKAPAEEVTDLALASINYIVEETKKLLEEDVIVQRIQPFIPAGDNPQLRDAVLVLRQVMQGLRRYEEDSIPKTDKLTGLIPEAKALREVLKIFVEQNFLITSRDGDVYLTARLTGLGVDWFSVEYPHGFLYEKLDALDVNKYFGERG